MSIKYNEDVSSPPEYLTLAIFEETLENAIRKVGISLQNVEFSMGSKTGENYCSLIYRVCLKYNTPDSKNLKELSVIIKSMPKTTANEFLDDLQVFLKEKVFYYEILPRMELLLGENKKFGARLYHHLRSPINTFIFEDLKKNDVDLASREVGLDMTHSKFVLKRLGKFHATSMVLAKKDPKIMEAFREGMLAEKALVDPENMLVRFFANHMDGLIDVVKDWKGYENITRKLVKYRSNLGKELIKVGKAKQYELKVLNHGDLWVNNILFKYDEHRKPIDLVFVDFQMSIWSSPGMDLNYFFNTSLQLNVLKNHREELIKVYHQSLERKLKELQYPVIPTFRKICEEVKQREPYGFFANFGIYPLVTLSKETSSDSSLDNLQSEEFAKQKAKQTFAAKHLQETMRYTLKRFEEIGVWD